MAAAVASPREVPTTLYYYLEPRDGGTIQTYPGTAAEKRRKHVPKDTVVHDMRPSLSDLTVDKCGFQLVDHVSREKKFDDEDTVRETYYPETAELIKKTTGASHVHVFSHLCRRETNAASLEAAKGKKDEDFVPTMNPARFCHVDQSFRGAEQILYLNLPEEEADRRSKTRWGIINVWRPIGSPVTRDPLAVCDYRSLDENDLRTVVANLPPKGAGDYSSVSQGAKYEVWNLAANPEQRWYYASEMSPEEALLIKIFDSKKDGRARCTAHTSFPLKDESGPPRQSVEIRCLVFWEDESVE